MDLKIARSCENKVETKLVKAIMVSALVLFASLVTMRTAIAFLSGVHPSFFRLFDIQCISHQIASIVGSIGLIVSGFLVLAGMPAFKAKPFTKNAMIWLLLAWVNSLPGGIPARISAVTALYIAGPAQVIAESRELVENCADSRCGLVEGFPPAIGRVHPLVVYASDEFVTIKKYGLGDFAGFIVYPENKGEERYGIRLYDTLYWADPMVK